MIDLPNSAVVLPIHLVEFEEWLSATPRRNYVPCLKIGGIEWLGFRNDWLGEAKSSTNAAMLTLRRYTRRYNAAISFHTARSETTSPTLGNTASPCQNRCLSGVSSLALLPSRLGTLLCSLLSKVCTLMSLAAE